MARYAFGRRFGASLATAAVLVLVSGAPANAAATATGAYADMSVGGSSGAFAGSADMSVAGFPSARVTSDATTVKTPSGESAFLGSATPVGEVYGSSRGENYLNVSTAKGVTTSTTTIDFDTATPAANWAFVLGDIDADMVEIAATDADGNPVAADDLGFSGVFNYCASSPKPSGCSGPGPFTDVPTWHPGSSRLVGNGPDTLGSAGWFQPKVPIKSLTFTFTALTGIPVYQVWLTTLSVPVETKVDGITPANPVPDPGVEIDLLESDGVTPVEQPDGKPVIEVADPKGEVVFPAVADGDYMLSRSCRPSTYGRSARRRCRSPSTSPRAPRPFPRRRSGWSYRLQLAKTGTDGGARGRVPASRCSRSAGCSSGTDVAGPRAATE